jgi:hypothetical protein
MYISEFQVGNYKSFHESGRLEFAPGFNIITGQNNVGKTALLEAISLASVGNPHRSLSTVPTADIRPDPTSWFNISLTLTRDELFELLLVGPRTYHVAQPAADSDIIRRVGPAIDAQTYQRFVEAVLASDTFTFTLRQENGDSNSHGPLKCARIPSFGVYKLEPISGDGLRSYCTFEVKGDRSVLYLGGRMGDDSIEIGSAIGNLLRSHVYKFSAERYNMGACNFGHSPVLFPNASNLPEVLNTLQANTAKFNEFNLLVAQILPQVRHISVVPRPSNRVEVVVWTVDPKSQRVDLAIPLSQSGTGIGQVLAILYVTLTAVRPQVILIDEPQSFLHPGAIRKLIEVLKTHAKHQFIIATHSPGVITSANPATISMMRCESGISQVDRIDVKETKALATYLNELGARLSDVFGADNILWVEGSTEELCFPLILKKIAARALMGTAVLGIRQVGDLEGRDAERVFEIYSRLSQSSNLLPPAIGFVFDAECRTENEQNDLRRRSRNRGAFLPRRMFENFLLDPDAIAAVANGIQGFRPTPIAADEIRKIIEAKRRDRKYICPAEQGHAGDWIKQIDGAKVLKEIFTTLSETRVSYQKTEHSVALAELIVEHNPEALREIADLLVRFLDAKLVLV